MEMNEEKRNNALLQRVKNKINRISFISGSKIWFVLLPIVFITAADQVLFVELLEVMQRDLGGYFAIAISESVFIISIAVFTLIFGYYSDKVSRKLLLYVGGLFGSIFILLTGFAYSLITLIIFRMFAGIGLGAALPVAFSLLSDSIKGKNRSKAFSIWALAQIIGGLPALAALGLVVLDVPFLWHQPFLLVGIIGLIMSFLPLFVKEPKRASKEEELEEVILLEGLEYSYRIKIKDLKVIYKRKSNFWLIINFIDTIAPAMLVAYIIPYISTALDDGIIDIFTLIPVGILILLGILFGNFGISYIADRLYEKDKTWRAKMAIICAIGEVPFVAIGIFLLPYMGNFIFSIIIGVNLGIGLAFTFGISPNWYGTLIDVNLPENRGTMIATATALDQGGRALGTMIGGVIATISVLLALQFSVLFMVISVLPWIPVLFYIRRDLEEINDILKNRAIEIKKMNINSGEN